MLKTNLFNKADENTLKAVALTTKFEGYNMMIELLNDKVVALQKKLENKNGTATAEMLKGYASELEETLKDIANYTAMADSIRNIAETIEVTLDRRLFRILASAENSKFEKYAITWTDDEAETLYDAMCNIHGFDGDAIQTINFKKSTDALERIVRVALTFDETEFSEKVVVRLNKTDLRMINETWTVGARNKYRKDKKNDTVTYKATEEKFIVSKRQKKGEDAVYDWSKFNAILVKIAIAKIANI